jgi:hypothetical protein
LFHDGYKLYCVLTGFDQFQTGTGEIDGNRLRRLATAGLARLAFCFFRGRRGLFYPFDCLLHRHRLHHFATGCIDGGLCVHHLNFHDWRRLIATGFDNRVELSRWLLQRRYVACIIVLRLAWLAWRAGLTRRPVSAFTGTATSSTCTIATRLVLIDRLLCGRLCWLRLRLFRLFDAFLPGRTRLAWRTGFLRFGAAVG